MSQRSPFKTALRDTLCGSLRLEHVGSRVRLGGWVHRRRDLGGLVFIDLRDRAGIVQISFDPAYASDETLELARSLGAEMTMASMSASRTRSTAVEMSIFRTLP